MSTNDQNGEDQRRAARLTAYALGQLGSSEQAAVEAELAASPQAREAVRAERALAAQLRTAAHNWPLPERSAGLRQAVERRLRELEAAGAAPPSVAKRPPRRRRPLWPILLVAATLLLAVVPAYFYLVPDGAFRPLGSLALAPMSSPPSAQATPERPPGETARPPSRVAHEEPSAGHDRPAVFTSPTKRKAMPTDASLEVSDKFGDLTEPTDPDIRSPAPEKPPETERSAKSQGEGPVSVHLNGGTPSDPKGGVGGGMVGLDSLGREAKAKGQDVGVGVGPGKNRETGGDSVTFDARGRGRTVDSNGNGTPGVAPPAKPANLSGDRIVDRERSAPEPLYFRINSPAPRRPVRDQQQGGGQQQSASEKLDEDLPSVLGLSVSPRSWEADQDKEPTASGATAMGLLPSLAAGQKPGDLTELANKKQVETWKPSRLVPNTSRLMVGDREELPLRGMQVDVRIDGFRARVVLDLYYFNDRGQQLEGNFQLRLPEEASPYFVAFGRTVYQAPQITPQDSMFFKREQLSQGDTTPERILALRSSSWEQPKVARMVPKEKAAYAYRETVRRRVDPALVEWSGAGVFQCRVFPLAPRSLHRVVIGYDVDLLHVGDDLELRLDLPEHPPATIVDFNVAAGNAKEVSLDAPATKLADGQRLSYRLIDPRDRPLSVRLHKPGTLMLTGADEATGNYFATRVGLSLPETPAAEGSKEAVFLVDTSLSAAPQLALWTKLLRATLENNRDRIERFAVLFFNVETFWWQEQFVPNTPENVDALMQYADGLALEGATDLGRALQAAASPAWRKKAQGLPPEMFLLSDGAATWGEDRWPPLSKALTPSPSPKGPAERCGPLFAYHTGLAGSDPRTLTLLADETGGAVFSVVGEAEVARASVAHRARPWRLTGVEAKGGHDVLVAGRPRFVFPNQQLLVVGRLDSQSGLAREEGAAIAFTLQQGAATQTVQVKVDHIIASELAARTYGQVATGQLEDLSQAAEPVATVYARHFRITGRTCSLLMLESEQDYARYNIKPEEDDFVVKDRPAAAVVEAAERPGAAADAKTLFMDWYRKLGRNEQVRFDLPAALGIALEGLPAEAFQIVPPELHCKLRMQKDLPENFRQPWRSGAPDYDTLAGEAERRWQNSSPDDALRALSSLVEDRPGDAALARDVAFASIAWGRPGAAYHLLRRAAVARTFEPVTFHALAHCLEQLGNTDMAIVYYELACGGQWDGRFGDVHNIAQLDYLRFLRRLSGNPSGRLGNYAQARMAILAAAQLRDTADLAALILWNTDGTDVDLHVTEPNGEECFFSHPQTASGGRISRDVTTGYGPELYLLPQAPAGTYSIRAHYFATDANRASTRTKVLALIYQGWGTKDERLTIKAVPLVGRSESHDLAKVQVEK
ncbi:MAG: hypothetical protein ABSF26_11885 [Thermoguttaceae bacterium]